MDAFKTIVEQYPAWSIRWPITCSATTPTPKTLAQEAFLRRSPQAARQHRSEATFSTWLFRLALTAAVDYKRRERRRPEPVGGARRRRGGAGRAGRGHHRRHAHSPALHDLPDDYRVPTVLRDIYGLPYQEIADRTARPLGTVKVMVHRGRASLRLRLQAEREA